MHKVRVALAVAEPVAVAELVALAVGPAARGPVRAVAVARAQGAPPAALAVPEAAASRMSSAADKAPPVLPACAMR